MLNICGRAFLAIIDARMIGVAQQCAESTRDASRLYTTCSSSLGGRALGRRHTRYIILTSRYALLWYIYQVRVDVRELAFIVKRSGCKGMGLQEGDMQGLFARCSPNEHGKIMLARACRIVTMKTFFPSVDAENVKYAATSKTQNASQRGGRIRGRGGPSISPAHSIRGRGGAGSTSTITPSPQGSVHRKGKAKATTKFR